MMEKIKYTKELNKNILQKKYKKMFRIKVLSYMYVLSEKDLIKVKVQRRLCNKSYITCTYV